MRKNLKSKILLSILAASVFYLPAYANAASLEITNETQATDSKMSDWLHDVKFSAVNNHTQAIYHAPEADGNQLTITGLHESLENCSDFTAAYIKMDNNGNATEAKLEKNEVSINGSTFTARRYFVYGAYTDLTGVTNGSKARLINNTVNINSATFSNTTNLYGAYAMFNENYNDAQNYNPAQFNATANLQNNSVIVSDSNFNNATTIHGAYASLRRIYYETAPSNDTAASLTDNSVTINADTTFAAPTYIYGAQVELLHSRRNFNGITLSTDLTGNTVTINDGTTFAATTYIYGAYADLNRSPDSESVNAKTSLTNNTVNINGGTFTNNQNNSAIYGAYINLDNVLEANGGSSESVVNGNKVTISGGTFANTTNVYGAYAYLTTFPDENEALTSGTATITDNTITLTGSAGNDSNSLSKLNLYGYAYNDSQDSSIYPAKVKDQIDNLVNNASNNNLIVDGWSGTVGSVNNFDAIDFENIKVSKSDDETKAESVFYIEATGDKNKNLASTTVNINSVAAGDYAQETQLSGTLTLDKDIDYNKITISDKLAKYTNEYFASDNGDNGVVTNAFSSLSATKNTYEDGKDHVITISATVKDTILAGKFIDTDGKEHINSNGNASLTVDESLNDTNASVIAGAYALGDKDATGGNLIIKGGTLTKDLYGGYSEDGNATNNKVIIEDDYQGTVYAGYSEGGAATGNEIILTNNAIVSDADLYGGYSENDGAEVAKDNKLTVDDWKGTVNSLNNFAAIDFNNIEWKDGDTVLTIADTDADLSSTAINLNSLKGGSTIKAGDTMTFVASADPTHNLGITSTNVTVAEPEKFFAGVALEGEGTYSTENGSLTFTINTVELTPQTDIVAETRAASAAFVNQGTDLINDSLDVLGRDGTYGVKTFAAVQGNRSSYDVADDLKINGWSVIAGFGAENEHKGGDFAWGVFYENGSGNYRTYNTFNNEFFRGDGSMVYNGGGIAARYENAKGVYTEGSLRAGMLKTEMDNALRDSSGASYGYDSESTYYGAHVGVGQIFELSENTDLDVYGKFFHTYVEGDSFTVGSDKFDFDSVTSDRLRVGARVTKQQAKVNTYYGLAYEYEFNGDADMTAQGIRAERQSFGGGSGIAELGFNYQPGTDSPWNFDLNLRGYVGERQGGSFNVQATYTF